MIPLEIRFNKYFEKVQHTGCWEWLGGRTHDNYGKFWMDKTMKAHKVSFLLYKGEVPQGMVVMHICDNPPCVNPDHLRLGTQLDNIRDRDIKGRTKKGKQRKFLLLKK